MVLRLDRSVGRVLDRITSLGLDDDTVVFFTSDNGAPRREVVADFFGSHAPFREGKGSLHEGGIRAAMIVRWPGRIPAGTRTDFPWAG
jgi:arylsulfatase A-like enzyme